MLIKEGPRTTAKEGVEMSGIKWGGGLREMEYGLYSILVYLYCTKIMPVKNSK